VTRGQLPQRAGLPGLNGGGAATAVPPYKQTDPENRGLARDWVPGATPSRIGMDGISPLFTICYW